MGEDEFSLVAATPGAIGLNLSILRELAVAVRRMKADESYDDSGVRTIWHRGKGRVEMLTWEDKEEEIVRQELSVFGFVVEYRAGKGVTTGRVADAAGSVPTSKMVDGDSGVSSQVLDYGSFLLRHFTDRDYYAQHMLKQINKTVTRHGFDRARTQVERASRFSREPPVLPAFEFETWQGEQRAKRLRGLLIASAVVAVAGLGLISILAFM